MITDEMRAAGWRECPAIPVYKAWRSKGGEWQHKSTIGMPTTDQNLLAYRPVNSTTWDYCPDGWRDAVKIERWLTEEDIETHGNLWRWWSDQWTSGTFISELAMVYVANGEIRICADNESNWGVDDLSPGDYFTPARAG